MKPEVASSCARCVQSDTAAGAGDEHAARGVGGKLAPEEQIDDRWYQRNSKCD